MIWNSEILLSKKGACRFYTKQYLKIRWSQRLTGGSCKQAGPLQAFSLPQAPLLSEIAVLLILAPLDSFLQIFPPLFLQPRCCQAVCAQGWRRILHPLLMDSYGVCILHYY